MNPRPSSRIKSLETKMATVEAAIEEVASDTAEELKSVRQEIKSLKQDMLVSFEGTEKELHQIETMMSTRDDIKHVEERLDSIESSMAAMEGRINGNIVAMKTELLDAIKQLWQQRPSE